MSNPEHPKNPLANGEEINITPGFEEKLVLFWERNRRGILFLCMVVLIVIVAKGGWEYVAAQNELGVQKDYAAASSTEELKSFANANAGHDLAGVAWLRVADAAYASGNGSEAVTAYVESRKTLKTGPLADRATLGLAMSQLQAGQNADGEEGLKQLADAIEVGNGVRVEAAYQLASIAYTNGNADQVKLFADQIMQIDPSSPWAQRALTLQMKTLGPPETAVIATPDVEPSSATDEPVIKLNLGDK